MLCQMSTILPFPPKHATFPMNNILRTFYGKTWSFLGTKYVCSVVGGKAIDLAHSLSGWLCCMCISPVGKLQNHLPHFLKDGY